MAVILRLRFVVNGATSKSTKSGGHILLQTETPSHHRVSIPDHKPLRLGTFNAILREVATAKQTTREAIIVTL